MDQYSNKTPVLKKIALLKRLLPQFLKSYITPEEESSIEVTHAPEKAIVFEEIQNHEDAQVLTNDEISINYTSIGNCGTVQKWLLMRYFALQ